MRPLVKHPVRVFPSLVEIQQQRQEILEQEQQKELYSLSRQYGFARQRAWEQARSEQQQLQSEYEMVKHNVQVKAQELHHNHGTEHARIEELRKRIVEHNELKMMKSKSELQAKALSHEQHLEKQLNDQRDVLTRLHLAQKTELHMQDQAQAEAHAVWQWVVDSLHDQSADGPLSAYFPAFDIARHDRGQLNDFVQAMHVELESTMVWSLSGFV